MPFSSQTVSLSVTFDKVLLIKGPTFLLQLAIHYLHIDFRHKLRKWWSQSYLVGIPSVICGFRDVEGIVHTLKMYKVEDMPQLCKVSMLVTYGQFLCYSACKLLNEKH